MECLERRPRDPSRRAQRDVRGRATRRVRDTGPRPAHTDGAGVRDPVRARSGAKPERK